MRGLMLAMAVAVVGVGGVSGEEIFSDGFESGGIWGWSAGWNWRECSVFSQDCSSGDACYLLLVPNNHYPTLCLLAVPEPDPPDGCGTGLPRPGWQGECCSYINTCDRGLGCTQPGGPSADYLVCATFCDPTGLIGPDDCVADLGPGFFCLQIDRFYYDIGDLEDYFGFCAEEAVWGPPTCWNGVQDPDEDGIDCCIEPGGNPACPCVRTCG